MSLSAYRLAWILIWLLFVVAVVGLMLQLRSGVLASYGTEQQQTSWEAWRSAANQPSGGVKRRAPSSNEPPALVLMRDYFPMCVAAAVVFGSALFVVSTVVVVGALRKSPAAKEE